MGKIGKRKRKRNGKGRKWQRFSWDEKGEDGK
jgi:hypothetical protein